MGTRDLWGTPAFGFLNAIAWVGLSVNGGKNNNNPGINPGQLAGKGRKKKTLDINPGQHHLKYTEAGC